MLDFLYLDDFFHLLRHSLDLLLPGQENKDIVTEKISIESIMKASLLTKLFSPYLIG